MWVVYNKRPWVVAFNVALWLSTFGESPFFLEIMSGIIEV